jgi:uncharacterized membrane protein
VGNELAVSLFVNPAIWKLDESAQVKALGLLARSLGAVMPFWYFLSLILLIGETYVRRHGAHPHLLHASVAIWVVTIIYTVTILVPINKRIARLNADALPSEWRSEHGRWDTLHRWRILMLTIAFACIGWVMVALP